ncbi:MAG: hypothetical protein QXS40_05005, partial [Candidatus Nitrosocaldus sp.]
DKNNKELLLMVREEIQKIKEIIEELKTPLAATVTAATTPPTTAANTPTATSASVTTANTNADLPSLAS